LNLDNWAMQRSTAWRSPCLCAVGAARGALPLARQCGALAGAGCAQVRGDKQRRPSVAMARVSALARRN